MYKCGREKPSESKSLFLRLRLGSLRGTWCAEHLFALRQAVQSYEHYQLQIKACDGEIAEVLKTMGGDDGTPVEPKGPRKRPGSNAPKIEGLRTMLIRLCGGSDATVLPAHTEYSVLQLIGEVGTDLRAWPTEKQFTSWAGLVPGVNQSGKRRRSVKRSRNRTGRLFCVMARSLAQSKNVALGGFYRRIKGRRGGLVAIVAVARKLAELFWRTLVKGVAYVEEGLERYEMQMLENKERLLRKLARQLGKEVIPKTTATTNASVVAVVS
jgi:transposase